MAAIGMMRDEACWPRAAHGGVGGYLPLDEEGERLDAPLVLPSCSPSRGEKHAVDDDDCFFGLDLGGAAALGGEGPCGLALSDDAVFADEDDTRCFSLTSDDAGRYSIDTVFGDSPRGNDLTRALGGEQKDNTAFGGGGAGGFNAAAAAVKPCWGGGGGASNYCGSPTSGLVPSTWPDAARTVKMGDGNVDLCPGAAMGGMIAVPGPMLTLQLPTTRRGSNSHDGATSESNSMHSILSMASMATGSAGGGGSEQQHCPSFSASGLTHQQQQGRGGGGGVRGRYTSFTSELKTVGSVASMASAQGSVEGWGCHQHFTPQLAHVASWPQHLNLSAYPSSTSASPTAPSSSTMLNSAPSAPPAGPPPPVGHVTKRIVVPSRRAADAAMSDDASLMASFASKGKKRAPGSQGGRIAPNPNGLSCTACGTQTTPVWRAGPHGPKTLCNACGVRFMKVAKRK